MPAVSAALWVAFFGVGLVGQVQEVAADGAFLLRGGTVHTISGPLIENGSVLVRNGRILAVGRDLQPPQGTQIIDVHGGHIYPGMIDSAYRHLTAQLNSVNGTDPASEQFAAARGNGVTSVVEMPEGELIAGQLSLIRLDASASYSTTAAVVAIHLRFPAIETTPIPPHEVADDDDEPATAREEQTVPYPEAKRVYSEKMKQLTAFFGAARRYRRTHRDVDPRYEAMIPVLDGLQPLFVTAVREREIRDAISFADRQKVRIVLADAFEAYRVLPLIKAHNIPVVLGPTFSLPLNRDDPYDVSYTTPAMLYKAGIRFSIGTFSSRLTRNLPYQAAAAVPFGLPPEEAYKAVSLNAAEIFGRARQLGSIDEGKIADLIVTDGDPLETTTQIRMVFINGKPADLDSRQKRLYEQYIARP
jgi:hypothetical protein